MAYGQRIPSFCAGDDWRQCTCGQKPFLAIEDGVRESTQSWRDVLLKLKSRGMKAPPLGIGEGTMGFWAALDEVYPETRHQRCWMHKTANVLNTVPKSLQPRIKQALHEIWQAETRDEAQKAFDFTCFHQSLEVISGWARKRVTAS